MLEQFFLWCAGSDKEILNRCPDYEKTKHIGFGTLVLSPAILAFISMSYALSTIEKISKKPDVYLFGGLIWGLIIFSFDRFIVSTHRREKNNLSEFRNISFYFRLLFSITLGMVISHPFVLMYFEKSIVDKINLDSNISLYNESVNFQKNIENAGSKLNELTKRKACLEKLLTAEQSGQKVELDCGYSSGIPNINGNFPRTKIIEEQIRSCEEEIQTEKRRISGTITQIETIHRTKSQTLNNPSYDYLNREAKLEDLKKGYPIIGFTQLFLMTCFVLVDVLPVTLKTFAPYGMYDQIISDDLTLLANIDSSSRRAHLQKLYNDIHDDKRSTLKLSKIIDDFSVMYNATSNILTGIVFAVIIFFIIFRSIGDLDVSQILKWSAISSIILSVVSNAIYDTIKKITSDKNLQTYKENA